MPSLQDIERFKRILDSLGGESRILEERGERWEDVEAPEEDPSRELGALLAGLGDDIGGEELPAGEDLLPEEDLFPEEDLLPEEDILDVGSPAEEDPTFSADADPAFPADEDFSLPDEFAIPPADDEEPEILNLPDADPFDAPLDGILDDENAEEAEDPSDAEEEIVLEEDEFGAFGEESAAFGEDSGAFDEESDASAEEPAAFGRETGPEELAPVDEADADDFEIEEFDLGDIGEHFGIGAEEDLSPDVPPSEQLNPATAVGETVGASAAGSADPSAADAGDAIRLSDEDFRAVRETLARLPRNVKIAVEELIGEGMATGEGLRKLIDLLVRGESARAIASCAGSILGKKLQVPKGYERKSGSAFEVEKSSFAYTFRENLLPILRALAVGTLLIVLLTVVSYQFVYRPLRAHHLYSVGYEKLAADDFPGADSSFDAAVRVRPVRRWFLRYADGFAGKRRYYMAEEKYEQFLARWPSDREAVLAYANLETYALADYEKADALLDRILEDEMYDFDALLARGDNFLEWADEEPARYEDARIAYATLLQQYGDRDQLLFRMLTYFIRTDNRAEVLRLKDHFQAKKKVELDVPAYAELGGYLIDRKILDEVPDILFRALEDDPGLPEIHYHLARYFRETEKPGDEARALENARRLFERSMPLGRRRLTMLIDTCNRSGEVKYRRGEYLAAERDFREGIDRYEDARERRILGREERFGLLYANLGDVYYYESGQYDEALKLYEQAEDNLYRPPEIKYKKGFIHYRNGRYDDAVVDFHAAADGFSENPNLLFATANTLSRRGEHFAAQGYYHNLLDILERERSRIRHLRLEENPQHRALMEFLVRGYNNLGVTLDRLARQTGDRAKSSQGMVYLTYSSDYWDLLSRDPETLERGLTRNLAFLNTRGIIYPAAGGFELQIYGELPPDMEAARF